MRLAALILGAALLTAGCGSDGDGGAVGPADGGTPPADDMLRISANNIAFSTSVLRAPPGEITIVFENDDQGIPHNIEVNGPNEDHATDIDQGPVTQTLTFTIEEPGTYTFLCVVHPSQMEGDLVVG